MKLKPWMWKVLLIVAGIVAAFIAGWVRAVKTTNHLTKVQEKYNKITNDIMAHDSLDMTLASQARDQATLEVYSETKQAVIDRFMANFGSPPDLSANSKPTTGST